MFKIINQGGINRFYDGERPLGSLFNNSYIEFNIKDEERSFQKNYANLDVFLDELDLSTVSDNCEVYLVTVGRKQKIHLPDTSFDINDYKHSAVLTISYMSEHYEIMQGLSDYSHCNFYMPKWSTAYKTPYSNHVRMIEPLSTDVLNSSLIIKNIVQEKPEPTLKSDQVIFYKLGDQEIVSDKFLSYMISSQRVEFNNICNLDFGTDLTSVYVRLRNKGSYRVKITGIYDQAIISETIYIEGLGIHKLNLKYNKIFKVNVLDIYADSEKFNSLYVSNAYTISSFDYYGQPEVDYKLSGNYLYKTLSVTDGLVFRKNLQTSQCYLDSDDNLLAISNGQLYCAKLDLNIDLKIPQNMTYNNTKYITTTYLGGTSYEIYINLEEFRSAANSADFKIKIQTNKQILYVNNNLKLIDEDSYVSGYDRPILDMDIELDDETEYAIITLEDPDKKYSKSNLIVHPVLNFIPSCKLYREDKLFLANDSYYIYRNYNKRVIPLIRAGMPQGDIR